MRRGLFLIGCGWVFLFVVCTSLTSCARKPAPRAHTLDVLRPEPARGITKYGYGLDGWGRAAANAPRLVLYFDFDSARLSDTAAAAALADYLRKTGASVRLEGHTCPIGDELYNLSLGLHRAEALRAYLVSAGVLGGHLETVSYGEEHLATVDPAEYSLNRRVEVRPL